MVFFKFDSFSDGSPITWETMKKPEPEPVDVEAIVNPSYHTWINARAKYSPEQLWMHTQRRISDLKDELFDTFLHDSRPYKRAGVRGVVRSRGSYFAVAGIVKKARELAERNRTSENEFSDEQFERRFCNLLFGHISEYQKEGFENFKEHYVVDSNELVTGINRLAHGLASVYENRLRQIHKIKKVYGRRNEENYKQIIADELKRK